MQNPLTEILAVPSERLNDPKFNRYMNEKSGVPLAVLDTLGTDTSNVTNVSQQPTLNSGGHFNVDQYLTPPYFGVASSLFIFTVLASLPGKSYTRVHNLDEPNDRSRDWLKISLTSAGLGVSIWFITAFLSEY